MHTVLRGRKFLLAFMVTCSVDYMKSSYVRNEQKDVKQAVHIPPNQIDTKITG